MFVCHKLGPAHRVVIRKIAEPPHCKAARLSFRTRSFPYLPLGRFGFISIYMQVYSTKAIDVKPDTKGRQWQS